MLLTLTLLACAPLQPNVQIDFLGETPLEVDTIANDTDGDGMVSGYVAEEMTVALRIIGNPNVDVETIQPSVDFQSYALSYQLLNAEAAAPEMPAYENGVTIHLESGESGEYPIRATSFVQKDWAHSQFDGAARNYTASLTLNGQSSDGVTVKLDVDFDIIFADFAEP